MDNMDVQKMNKWVLGQINPETYLETKITKLKLSYFGHIMKRQCSSKNTIILGKTKGSRK